MIATDPDLPDKPRRRLTWRTWLLTGVASVVIVGVLLLIVLPGLWRVLFPTDLTKRTETFVLLNEVNLQLHGFIVGSPNTSIASFLRPSEANGGAKALYRMLVDKGYLSRTSLEADGSIATDADGVPMLVDAWGNPLVFIPGNDTSDRPFQLRSVGPNGRDDGGGDDDLVLKDEKTRPVR